MASLAELYGQAATSYGKARAKARQIPANLRESGKGLASWAVDPYGEAQRVMGEYRNMTPEQRQGLVNAAVDLFGGVDVGPVGAIKASHGGPHLFDRFDFSKIGTGEGAQAYGHGGYFAQGFDSPVAKKYRDALSDAKYVSSSGKDLRDMRSVGSWGSFVNEMRRNGKSDEDIINYLNTVSGKYADSYGKTAEKLAEKLKSGSVKYKTGNLYNVELKWPDAAREAADPLGEHHLLDWDAPLSEQNPNILNALRNVGVNVFSEPKSSIIKDLDLRNIVKSALKQDVPKNVGLMVDNDYQLYQRAMNLAEKMGVNIDEASPGDFVAEQAADYLKALSNYRGQTGESVYRALMENPTSMVEATQKLRNVGIPGIRYLDQASRDQGKGTRNYVMFDDRFPNIVTRNGVSITDLLKNR